MCPRERGGDQMQEKLVKPAPGPAALLLLRCCTIVRRGQSKERGAFGICAEREQENRRKKQGSEKAERGTNNQVRW